jgi:hypothetical protein
MNLSLAMPTQGVDTECLPRRLFGKPKGASHGQISDRSADAVARRELKMGPALIETRLDRLPRAIKRAPWGIL